MAVTDGRRDSGPDYGKLKKFLKTRAAKIIFYVSCALVFLGICCLVYKVYRAQESKINALEAEKAQLEQEVDDLTDVHDFIINRKKGEDSE